MTTPTPCPSCPNLSADYRPCDVCRHQRETVLARVGRAFAPEGTVPAGRDGWVQCLWFLLLVACFVAAAGWE